MMKKWCCIFAIIMVMPLAALCGEVSENEKETLNSTSFNATDPVEEEERPCPPVSDRDIFDLTLKNYSKLARPHRNGSEAILVSSALRLFGMQDFVERESIIYTNAYLDLAWIDEYMQWDWSWPHNCLKSIVLPADMVWMPDFVLLNSPDNPNFVANSQGLKIIIGSDGSVLFSSLGRLQTICEMDLKYFPFDRQICPIHFEAWTYPTTQEHLTDNGESNMTIITQLWAENKQWRLIANYTYFGETIYPDDSFDKVIYFLILERKALFFYVNVIIPSLVIAIVELVTFFLPLTEVVKVHISFTCLLAYSVFQSMVIAELPRTSSSVPLLCLYIDLQMSYIGLALVGEGVVFFFAEYAVKKKPVSVKILNIAKIVGRFVLVQHAPKLRPRAGGQNRSKAMKLSQAYFQLIPKEKFSAEYTTALDLKAPAQPEPASSGRRRAPTMKERQEIWLFIGEVTERINFLTYICLISVTPAIIFGVIPYQQPDIFQRLHEEFLR